jgi:hypothetical protein
VQARCWECREADFPVSSYQRHGYRGQTREFLNVLVRDPCAYCGSHERVGADHIDPSRHTGDSSIANLTGACAPCNYEKDDSYLLEHLLGEDLFVGARFQPYYRPPTPNMTVDLISLASSEVAKHKFSTRSFSP